MRTIAVRPCVEGVVLDGKANCLGHMDQPGVSAMRIITIQTGAYFRERVAIGLSNIENRNWTEICHDPDALVGLAVGVIRGDSSNNWGQDPDGLLAAADAPPQLSPRVEACHASRRWLLDEDQNGVAE